MLELDAEILARAVDPHAMVAAMRDCLIAASAGQLWTPLRTRWSFRDPDTTFLVMAASAASLGLSLVKTLTIVPGNTVNGKPAIHGEVTVFDRATGIPIARLDAEVLTALRTAACSAAATDLLAAPGARVLAIFGSGPQAVALARAMCLVRPIGRLFIFGRDPGRAAAISKKLQTELDLPVSVERELARLKQADIICTATNSAAPLFDNEHLAPRVHVNAIGSFKPQMRELSANVLRGATVFVDNAEFCAAEAGELIDAFGTPAEVKTHVTEVGHALARPTVATGVTVYKSVGNAGQDLFAAASVLAACR